MAENTDVKSHGLGWKSALAILGIILLLGSFFLPSFHQEVPYFTGTRRDWTRNAGIAVLQHDLAKGYIQATALQPQFEPNERLSWIAELLPFIERNDIFVNLDFEKKWNDPKQSIATEKVLIYPFVDPYIKYNTYGEFNEPITHLIGVSGVGRDAASLNPSDPDAGIFLYNHKTTLDSVSKQDGLSTTILIAPTFTDVGPWAAGGKPTVRGLEIEKQPYIGYGNQFGGFHKQGNYIIVCFADQHTKRIPKDIDPKVFRAMFTKNGGEELDEDEIR
ncbi:Hypothetical protein PBC10988_9280 [Planctomycetales bacterium 10988]|nr:Hypothetical protein PBC10988_9280 [Planctomycetales bacterium 10988]